MNIPFVDLEAQYNVIKPEVLKAITEVVESRQFIMGKYEKEFSEKFSNVHGSKFTVGCSNGTQFSWDKIIIIKTWT